MATLCSLRQEILIHAAASYTSMGAGAPAFAASKNERNTSQSMPSWPPRTPSARYFFHTGWSYCSRYSSALFQRSFHLKSYSLSLPSKKTLLLSSMYMPFVPCTWNPRE